MESNEIGGQSDADADVNVGDDGVTAVYVLSKAAVKAGIAALKGQRIHEHLPAYLQLRKLAVVSGTLDHLEPDWNEVKQLLRMPGGPPTKPHYRPFSLQNVKDESKYWFNKNLAGSYAPKSMRANSRFMLDATGEHYKLPNDHAHQALSKLLRDVRVPAWALAAFYLRNYGFVFTGDAESLGPEELVAAFRTEWALDDGDDFGTLFSVDGPIPPVDIWFELNSLPPDGQSSEEGEDDG